LAVALIADQTGRRVLTSGGGGGSET